MKKRLILYLSALLTAVAAALAWAFYETDRHPDKLWLHRCDSMEKLLEMHGDYPNIEVDLVFHNDGSFDVTHDSLQSIGLYFERYLEFLQDKEGHMWLDVKNLCAANKQAVLSSLDSLLQHYRFSKQRLIVEIKDWHSLELLTRHGYYTSCYVDYDKPSNLTDEETAQCIAELQKVAASRSLCALSFPAWWYDDIKEAFADVPIDLLTWKHRTTQLEFFLTPSSYEMLNDKQLKVILIKEKGHYHR